MFLHFQPFAYYDDEPPDVFDADVPDSNIKSPFSDTSESEDDPQILTVETVKDSDVSAVRSIHSFAASSNSEINMQILTVETVQDSEVSAVRSINSFIETRQLRRMVFDSDGSNVTVTRKRRHSDAENIVTQPHTTLETEESWSPPKKFSPFKGRNRSRNYEDISDEQPEAVPVTDPDDPILDPDDAIIDPYDHVSDPDDPCLDPDDPVSAPNDPFPGSDPDDPVLASDSEPVEDPDLPDIDRDDYERDPIPKPDLDDSYEEMFLKFGHIWLASLVSHKVSITAASYLWRIAFLWIGCILDKKAEENVKGKVGQFAHLRRKIIQSLCPPVSIRVCYKNLKTGNITAPKPSEVNHFKQFSDINHFQKLSEITSVKVKDVLKIHKSRCSRHQQDLKNMTVDLSCDGVADSKSSSVTMDMYTLSFPECRTVYPLAAIRPDDKSSIHFQDELSIVLDDLKSNNIKIRNVLADNPMRALMRNCKNHAGYFSCEYCRASATYCHDDDNREAKKTILYK